jgi:diguanylate cyclase (GGDEF)-like protein
MSLSLDAILCCAISAALTRVLSASADALWSWSGAMLCFAVSFGLLELTTQDAITNPILVQFMPHAFGVIGCACAHSASMSLGGRRPVRWTLYAALTICLVIGASLSRPDASAERASLAFFSMAVFLTMASIAFISESRWRSQFGGWLAILSTLSMAILLATSSVLLLMGWHDSLSFTSMPSLLFTFEACFLASSFAFILSAGELGRSQAIELSMRDGLTGLLTKRAFFETCVPAISRARRQSMRCCALMVDIDFFKRVNDTHGHLAGDAVIAHASSLISSALRSSDICARFGGEEFCLLLPDTDIEGARQVALRILESSREQPAVVSLAGNKELVTIPFTVSIGLHVQKLSAQDTLPTLLSKADEALYSSKRSGRDRLTCTSTEN